MADMKRTHRQLRAAVLPTSAVKQEWQISELGGKPYFGNAKPLAVTG